MTAATNDLGPFGTNKSIHLFALSLIAACLLGQVAWAGHLELLAFSPLMVLLWAKQASRARAWLIALVYFGAVARDLPSSAAAFFGDGTPEAVSIQLWLGSSLALSLSWALFWTKTNQGWWWRIPCALIVITVPPIGLVGWGNPLLAAGFFFPGWGWGGLVSMLVALVVFVYRPINAAFVFALIIAFNYSIYGPDDLSPPDWLDVQSTSYGGNGGRGRDFLRDFNANQDIQQRALKSQKRYVLFPETVAGIWNESTQALWSDTAKRLKAMERTAIVGVEIPVPNSQKTRNSLVLIGAEQGELQQRIPVLVSMWRPWADDGTEADIFGAGIAQIGGVRVATFICYEQLLPWSALFSMSHKPSLLLGAANAYWAAGTSIPKIQTMSLNAWAKLFGVPVVQALNF